MENTTPRLDRGRDRTIDSDQLVCPTCSSTLSLENRRCRHCGIAVAERAGVLSFGDTETESVPTILSEREREELATRAADQPIRDVTDDVLDGNERRSAILSELYDVRRDPWRVLTGEHVSGRCLDLYAGFGRRSMLLGELCETVYAVDPDLSKLRVTAGRDDYGSADRVVPLHTTVDRLPFTDGSLDTIVADFTGRADVQSELTELQRYLADDGSLLFMADGWTRKTGITGMTAATEFETDCNGDLLPGTPDGYRSLARSMGFDHASVYALFPTAERPLYAFNVEDGSAVRRLVDLVLAERGRLANACQPILSLLNTTGVLKRCCPSYLVVCTNERKPPSFEFDSPLVVSGRSRSIVLDIGTDGIESVWKIPNRADHAPLTEQEHSILSILRSSDDPITATVPDGEAIDSRFGVVRKERPADGRPLDETLTGSPQSFQRVLRTGFDWLAEFQRSFGGETVVRSPAEIRADLRFEPADLEPPEISESTETFSTPVHGDFLSANVYVSDGSVTTVIDWEYGALSVSPIIDAGWLLLDTATRVMGDYTDAVRTVLCGRNEYADRARTCVRDYCDAVGLPYRTFELYLPTAFRHRISVDWRAGTASTYTDRVAKRVRRMRRLFDVVDEMTLAEP